MRLTQKNIDKLVQDILNEEIDNKVSLIMEKLKGNQDKLDVAEPKGKLTADDFKKLRSSKKSETKEEEEMCSECGGKMYEGECSECGMGGMYEEMDEEDMEEGNAFSGALNKAKEHGDSEFTVDGKTYPVKENYNILSLTETELVNMIEDIIIEQKNKKEEDVKVSKVVNKVKDTIGKKYVSGLAKTNKSLDKSKKENDDYIASVTKKMKEYLKDGSDGGFEMNPTKFPKGNGQGKKDDTKAYHASDAVEEYIEAFSYPGMTNLVYDEIKPEDEKIEKQIKGHSMNGNAEVDESGKPLGNVVPSKVGDRFYKNYQDNLYGAEQMNASYKRYPQPVDMAGEKTQSGGLKKSKGAAKAQKILDKVDESILIKEKKIITEMEKMKNLFSYNKKTQ